MESESDPREEELLGLGGKVSRPLIEFTVAFKPRGETLTGASTEIETTCFGV
jgi:hypothetical protein